MNKAQLTDLLAERLEGDRRTAAQAIESTVDIIVRAVEAGENVTITGFGVFEKRERAARVARNPRTGDTVMVAPTAVPSFRPGTNFKAVVSGRTSLSADGPAVKRTTGRTAAPAAAPVAAPSGTPNPSTPSAAPSSTKQPSAARTSAATTSAPKPSTKKKTAPGTPSVGATSDKGEPATSKSKSKTDRTAKGKADRPEKKTGKKDGKGKKKASSKK